MDNETITQQTLDEINADLPQVQLSLAASACEPSFFVSRWEDSGLPPWAVNAMGRIDEAQMGLSIVCRLLAQDEVHSRDQADNGNVHYSGLEPGSRERLRCAQSALLNLIERQVDSMADHVRNHPTAARYIA